MNRRYASAVVANPFGTRTPAFDRFCTISPSDEFLPPTFSRSSSPSSENHSTLELISCLISVRVDRVLETRLCMMPGRQFLDRLRRDCWIGRLWGPRRADAPTDC